MASLASTRAANAVYNRYAVKSPLNMRWMELSELIDEELTDWLEEQLHQAYTDGQFDARLEELTKSISQ